MQSKALQVRTQTCNRCRTGASVCGPPAKTTDLVISHLFSVIVLSVFGFDEKMPDSVDPKGQLCHLESFLFLSVFVGLKTSNQMQCPVK